MKKILLVPVTLLLALMTFAQGYETVKNLLTLNQFAKAKEELDKSMQNAKFASKPEAYILKVNIYSALAMEKNTQNTPEGQQLTNDAEAAYAKYKEMQPDLSLMNDLIYQNGPINLYSSYYVMGYKEYQAKNWDAAYTQIKKAVDMSDFLIQKKILKTDFDTSVLILAGVTAENSKHTDEAVVYYTRLAERKVGGEGLESMYRYLVNHAYQKGDMAGFEKFKAIGKELYPKSEFFTYDNIDFAVGLAPDFNTKLAALDKVLAANPNDYKANEQLGMVIYDTLDSRKEDAVIPANADELEKKMVEAFNKAGAAKPDNELPYIYIGDHFISKAVKIQEGKEAFLKDMRGRVKPGGKPAPDDLKKRDEFDVKYAATLDQAREPYEKAAAIYASKGDKLSVSDKQQYKKAASYLSDIYANKKNQAKGKPADMAKYAAEEKKWLDIYDAIKLR